MATSPPQNPSSAAAGEYSGGGESNALVATFLSAPTRIWRLLRAYLPSSDSALVARIYDRRFSRRRRRRRPALPLLLLSGGAARSVRMTRDTPRPLVILEDTVEYTLSTLHNIQKSLWFWESRAEGTDSQKVYFMIFERGPRSFIEGTYHLLSRLGSNSHPVESLSHSASDLISRKLVVLTSLQQCLATFLAEIYSEVDKHREVFMEGSDKSLPTLFIILNSLFSKLETALSHLCESQNLLFEHGGSSNEPLFTKLKEIDVDGLQWTEGSTSDASNLFYQNLQKLDSYVSSVLSAYQKPRKMTIYWFRYTCGAVGLSACSIWILRHSSLMGSPDIDNWVHEAKDSMVGFWNEHVEKPVIQIRDDLFETFKRRNKVVMEAEEVKLTEDSLRRMLLAFYEQTASQKRSTNPSDQEMMELVMARFEKEVLHPLQNLFSGELARAMLIQIQKLKLDLETAMLELDQILKANAINFAILAALPAVGLSLLLLLLVRAWALHDKGAEGRGRIARSERRLLLVEVEKRLMEFQTYMNHGMEEEARCSFGLMLYSLDRLYKAVERHAKGTREWPSLREDIVYLAKPDLETAQKLGVISRIERMYNCLLPSFDRS